jgi:hypothetical protein
MPHGGYRGIVIDPFRLRLIQPGREGYSLRVLPFYDDAGDAGDVTPVLGSVEGSTFRVGDAVNPEEVDDR